MYMVYRTSDCYIYRENLMDINVTSISFSIVEPFSDTSLSEETLPFSQTPIKNIRYLIHSHRLPQQVKTFTVKFKKIVRLEKRNLNSSMKTPYLVFFFLFCVF